MLKYANFPEKFFPPPVGARGKQRQYQFYNKLLKCEWGKEEKIEQQGLEGYGGEDKQSFAIFFC